MKLQRISFQTPYSVGVENFFEVRFHLIMLCLWRGHLSIFIIDYLKVRMKLTYPQCSVIFIQFTNHKPLSVTDRITASIRERSLRATWAAIAAITMPAAAIREPKLVFVTERGFSCGIARQNILIIKL